MHIPVEGEVTLRASQVEDRRNFEMEATTAKIKSFATTAAFLAPPSGNAVSGFPCSTTAVGMSSSQVDTMPWNVNDESSEEEEDVQRNRSTLSGIDCRSEDLDISGSLSAQRSISRDFATNLMATQEATEGMRWHEVQAVPVLDPVTGMEVRTGSIRQYVALFICMIFSVSVRYWSNLAPSFYQYDPWICIYILP